MAHTSLPAGTLHARESARTLSGAPSAQEQVSVAGVVLLSAFAVALTIAGVVLLGLVMVGIWWLVSRIPVPDFVWHLLAQIGL